MKQVLIFDNYDSFTYNLYHLLYRVAKGQYEFKILRNKDRRILIESFDLLVISPGPMGPGDTGVLKELFDTRIVSEAVPVLGICLGMQFLAWYYGSVVSRSNNPVHGRRVSIRHTGEDIFCGVPDRIEVARYNSLEATALNRDELLPLATEEETGAVMALRHRSLPFAGLQFHPESFLTRSPDKIIENLYKQYVEN